MIRSRVEELRATASTQLHRQNVLEMRQKQRSIESFRLASNRWALKDPYTGRLQNLAEDPDKPLQRRSLADPYRRPVHTLTETLTNPYRGEPSPGQSRWERRERDAGAHFFQHNSI